MRIAASMALRLKSFSSVDANESLIFNSPLFNENGQRSLNISSVGR